MQKWEYKTVKVQAELESRGLFTGTSTTINTDEFDKLLNGYGSEGWELVSSFDLNSIQGMSRDIVAVMKRPLN